MKNSSRNRIFIMQRGKNGSYRVDTFREYMSYVEHMSKKSTRHSLSNLTEKIESANENLANP